MKLTLFLRSRPTHATCIGFLIIVTALLPCSLQAQNNMDAWQSQLTIYGWLPDIEGSTQFPSGASGPSIEIDSSTLLDNLEFTFMGAFEVSKGSWGAYTDLIYLKETARRSNTRGLTIGGAALPATVEANTDYSLKSLIWTLAGTYSLQDTSKFSTDLLFGARMIDMDQRLDWSFTGDISGLELPGRSGSSSVKSTNWDAVIGLKGRVFLDSDNHWVVPYYVDIGTGDSDLTWQAMTGIGYQFNWGAVVLNYRYLDYEPASTSKVTDFTLSGPMIGASFEW